MPKSCISDNTHEVAPTPRCPRCDGTLQFVVDVDPVTGKETTRGARCACGLFLQGHEARALQERRRDYTSHLVRPAPLLFLFLPDIVQLQETLPIDPAIVVILLVVVAIAVVMALINPWLRALGVAVFILVVIYLLFETSSGGWGL